MPLEISDQRSEIWLHHGTLLWYSLTGSLWLKGFPSSPGCQLAALRWQKLASLQRHLQGHDRNILLGSLREILQTQTRFSHTHKSHDRWLGLILDPLLTVFSFKKKNKLCMYVCACSCVCRCVCGPHACVWRLETTSGVILRKNVHLIGLRPIRLAESACLLLPISGITDTCTTPCTFLWILETEVTGMLGSRTLSQ